MNELEEQINRVLSDPGQMERLAGLARSLMGGEKAAPSAAPDAPMPDAALLKRLSGLMQNGGNGRETALLEAMRPWPCSLRAWPGLPDWPWRRWEAETMIHRYEGNTGRMVRMPEPPDLQPEAPLMSAPPPPFPPPPPPRPLLPGLPELSGLFRGLADFETEDLLLLLILYLMYRESGDQDLLIILAAMFLL